MSSSTSSSVSSVSTKGAARTHAVERGIPSRCDRDVGFNGGLQRAKGDEGKGGQREGEGEREEREGGPY